MKLKLSEFFLYLIGRRSFYGRLALSLQRIAKPGMGTLAVGIRDGRAVLFYDPAFLEDLGLNEAAFVLEHEMLHLMLDHIPRYLELLAMLPNDLERKKAGAVYNVAMDCAVNGLLREHPGRMGVEAVLHARIKEQHPEAPEDPRNGMCLPEKFDLPLDGSFESYQYLLMRRVAVQEVLINLMGPTTHDYWTKGNEGQDKGKGQGQGQGSGSDDSLFGDSIDGLSGDELLGQAHRVREQLKETMRSVVRSMGGIDRGTLPGHIEEWLADYLAEPIVPWWEVFATRARMSRTSKFRRSTTTPNRALLALSEEDDRIIPQPGRVRDKSWRVFLMVDTSGSMSSESLEIVKSELAHMLAVDEGMEIRYMQGDCSIQYDEVLKHGDEIPGQTLGRGGTDFGVYFQHMAQYVGDDAKCPDLCVVYTDGYAPPVPVDLRLPDEIPVLWLVTPEHSPRFHDDYGEIIVCDPTQNKRRK